MGISSRTTEVYFIICDDCGREGPITLDILQASELARREGYRKGIASQHKPSKWRCPDCLRQAISEGGKKIASLISELSNEAYYGGQYLGRMDKIRSLTDDLYIAWQEYLGLEGEDKDMSTRIGKNL